MGVVFAVALALPSFSMVTEAKARGARTSFSVQLKWFHQFQFAGYYMAVEKGFYADAGMDVELREAVPGQEPMDEVVKGRADFGAGTTDLLLMRSEGIPVVVLAAIFQHSPLAFMVKEKSGILNVHELARHKLMIEPHSAELLAYFAKEGVDLKKLDLVDHTSSIKDLIEDRVAGMSVYITDEPFLSANATDKIRILRPITNGIDFYGDNVFTMENVIRDHPKEVDAFIAATRKGWYYALDNIEETVDVILQKYSSRKSREHLLYEAKSTKSLIVPDVVEVGYMNPLRWERIAEVYKELGFLPEDFSLSGVLHSPDKSVLPPWVWKAIIGIAIVAFMLFLITAYIMRINRKLRVSEKELAASNRHKETLLSIIGHDIKNPIYALRRYGETLISRAGRLKESDIIKHGQKVLYGTDMAMDVLDNLLQWATLQQTDKKYRLAPVQLGLVVERNIDLFLLHAEAKNIMVNFDGQNEALVYGDEWRIDTVVRNILNNALKYCSAKDAISVHIVEHDDSMDVIVEDTGRGMSEADLALVLEASYQRGVGTMGEVGSGFGLPLCQQLMNATGGTMTLKNRSEGGLRVTLNFPKDVA